MRSGRNSFRFIVRWGLVNTFTYRRSMMGRIAFVTDSVAGMPADLVKKHDITVVPLQVIFGTESFRDGIDLTQDQFFERLKAAKNLPTTSQPSVADFEEAYKKLLDDPNVDSIISVHVSSTVPSGTYSS